MLRPNDSLFGSKLPQIYAILKSMTKFWIRVSKKTWGIFWNLRKCPNKSYGVFPKSGTVQWPFCVIRIYSTTLTNNLPHLVQSNRTLDLYFEFVFSWNKITCWHSSGHVTIFLLQLKMYLISDEKVKNGAAPSASSNLINNFYQIC